MVEKEGLFLFSGIASFSIYFAFLVLISFTFHKQKEAVSYGSQKKTSYEVQFIEKKRFTLSKSKKNKKKNKSESLLKKTLKKDGTTSKKEGVNIKSLFSKLSKKSKEVSKKYISSKNKDSASRKYGQGKMQEQSINDLFKEVKKINSVNSNSLNKYDEYYSKIDKIISNAWNNYISINGNYSLKVIINIDTSGNISSYRIIKESSNEKLNLILRDFLVHISKKQFPTFTTSREIEINFKIKE